ncbi:MAG TPA: hypothetical protein RMH85_04230 [Polyangiaceae bacterium LLY-WYZ-15_(1-7)]|nr:hypothetical protein [Myxococcales bacterium]MAT24085.1 hypothetical protein [Sandaracinus sp.]HJL03940.1 hypothetical protein [Polyangiaceae bacterium LLY-WYZ-15_(1-7)]HJL07676.1 hypothetical protein [Polyangiaceae bacterium LLY-WYZ-15_(1-7)]HJL27014.1 hypothetical protein [Polyangiaceae bacterium LLY-WYZ-15_(1-7)]
MDAIALIKVPLSRLQDAHGEGEADGELLVFASPDGDDLAVEPLDDGLKVHLGLPFSAEPDELGMAIRLLLGAHYDVDGAPRAYVYPDVAKPEATTVGGIATELGEGGMYVRVPSAEEVEAAKKLTADDAVDLFSAVQGMMGGDLIGQVQQAMADPEAGMGGLADLAKQLLGNEDVLAAVKKTASKIDVEGGAALPGGLLEQAQSIAGKIAQENPDLVSDLAQKVGGAGEGGGSAEDTGGDAEDDAGAGTDEEPG